MGSRDVHEASDLLEGEEVDLLIRDWLHDLGLVVKGKALVVRLRKSKLLPCNVELAQADRSVK